MKKQDDETLKKEKSKVKGRNNQDKSEKYCPYDWEILGQKKVCSCSPEQRRECAADV